MFPLFTHILSVTARSRGYTIYCNDPGLTHGSDPLYTLSGPHLCITLLRFRPRFAQKDRSEVTMHSWPGYLSWSFFLSTFSTGLNPDTTVTMNLAWPNSGPWAGMLQSPPVEDSTTSSNQLTHTGHVTPQVSVHVNTDYYTSFELKRTMWELI